MNIEKAIQKIKEFGLYHAIQDLPHSKLTVEAFDLAIKALEKQKYFRNCKDCACLEYARTEYGNIPYCEKRDVYDISPENDGCTFYEDWRGEN